MSIMGAGLSADDIELLYTNLSTFSPEEQKQILFIVEELERRNHAKRCENDLIEFCKHIDPSYKVATHHRKLAELLMEIAYGKKDRVAVSIPPRHGKSHLISTLFPAWFLGKYPDKKVLMASHTGVLAVDFGRKVRNIVNSEAYHEIFPTVSLASDSKSAARWNTNSGGEYFACGVGASIAGRGADLLLIDDPHSEQDFLAGNFDALEKAYQWFMGGARTRLMSGGRVAIVHCMVGDTNVLMADGSEKQLRSVRPGDGVAGYVDGKLVPTTILNWANQGPDHIYAIKTTSGKILRANGKHPLLANLDGEQKWTKVQNLKVGMQLVAVSRSLSSRSHLIKNVALKDVTTENMRLGSAHTTITKTVGNWKSPPSQIVGGNGRMFVVPMKSVKAQFPQKGYAYPTTTNNWQPQGAKSAARKRTGMRTLSTDMALALKRTTNYLQSKMESVLYAISHLAPQTSLLHGKVNWGLTTATMGGGLGGYYATPVTSLLVEETQRKPSYEPLSTYEPTTEQIVEIYHDGYEDVFDIQVEGTETFIANGVVSHNTRWHADDLIGHVVKDGANNSKADQYEIFEFPAVIHTDSGPKALWPDMFDMGALDRTKATMPAYQWNAQYMQAPTSEEAAIIKREDWRPWDFDDPPRCDYIIMALDAAAESHNRADFTAITTWGVFSDDNLTGGASHIILLNAINIRVEFPELKTLALKEYKEWEPDSFIVEKKSAGTQLYQELRRVGVPVQEFTPTKSTGDKVVRLNAVADILRSGMVWYPAGRRWAEEVIEQCVAFPYGSHDDLCIAKGTLIEMADGGRKAIEDVRVGDFVRTPLGGKKVVAAGYTGVRKVHRLQVSGHILLATGNHPIATGQGWKPLDTVSLVDTIKLSTWRNQTWLSLLKMALQRALCSMGASTTGTQTLPKLHTKGITQSLVGVVPSIGIYGSSIMGESQKSTMCTTKMGTGTTIALEISRVSQLVSTIKSTTNILLSSINARNKLRTSQAYAQRQQNGIGQKKEENGTEGMQQIVLGKLKRHLKWPVKSGVTTQYKKLVSSVRKRLRRFQLGLRSAQIHARVQAVDEINAPLPVYNLSVEGAKCYYANGILVHNCDTVSMSLARFRNGGFITLPTDTPDEPQYFKSHRHGGYY